MDSFEINKVAAAILIALLTIKGSDLISRALIHPKMLTDNVFKIQGVATSTVTGASAEKAGPAPIEPLLAKANAENGANIFKKCTSCHTAEKGGPNKIGPDLYNVVGAEKGKHPGFTYSQAMEKKGGTWTYEDLNHLIYNPRTFIPGTKMSFAGLKNDQERADVIAYLRQQNDNPPPLPEVKAAPAPEAQPAPEATKTPPGVKSAPGASPPPQKAAKTTPTTHPAPEAPNPIPTAQPTSEATNPVPTAQPTPEATNPVPTAQPISEAPNPVPTAQPTPEAQKPTPLSSSRNLENLSDVLISHRDTLYFFPLGSSPGRWGFNITCSNKTIFSWIPAYGGMTPVCGRQGIFAFNSYSLDFLNVRDGECWLAGEVHMTTQYRYVNIQTRLFQAS